MGHGSWSAATYRTTTAPTAFTYSTATKTASAATGKPIEIHPSLDPKGVKVRESRDSDDHPRAVPIGIVLDTTGSNISEAKVVHAAFPTLMGLLLRKGYCTDPQINFCAVGDVECDTIPFEFGQFESDNRIETELGNFALEGGGGGQKSESYELPLYGFARHTATDHWDKRGEKGYLFLVGDEMARDVSPGAVERVFGERLQALISLEDIVREVQEKWNTYFIIPAHASHGRDNEVRTHWSKLFQERCLVVEDSNDIIPTIASIVGQSEGMSEDDLVADLSSAGVDSKSLAVVRSNLAKVGSTNGMTAATVSGGDLATSGESTSVRL